MDVKHKDKDVNAVTSETAIGVDLSDGQLFAPDSKKLVKVFHGAAHFFEAGVASRLHVSALIGHLSWCALFVRALFCCFGLI